MRHRQVTTVVAVAAILGIAVAALSAADRGPEPSARANLPEPRDSSRADTGNRPPEPAATESPTFRCGYRAPAEWLADLRAAVDRGEIPDPTTRRIPPIRPGRPRSEPRGTPCLTPQHIFAFEDTDQLLLTDFSGGALVELMVTAANDLLSVHGDNYDFVGFWVNFTPHHTIGTAFYKYIENDVLGIGDPSTTGTPIFNLRPDLGLGGENIEGFVMMWNVNSSFWQPGDAPAADFTRLALGQEFEHRFAMYLPDLLDGRVLQGDSGSCGRAYHWSWKADGQGSSMEISEWVGSNPAILEGSFVTFNTDIGGVFSYSDLYLMGYVSPSGMDTGNSELRYMDNSFNCASVYNGPISHFTSTDIIAAAGPRVPDSAAAQKHFRTGWIMIHQPGDPPSQAELNKALGILEQHMIDWEFSTLGRGTMNNALFDDCNCNGMPDASEALHDFDFDCDVDMTDFAHFQLCFTGPGPSVLAPGCGVFDSVPPDDDVDLDDLVAFNAALTGPG